MRAADLRGKGFGRHAEDSAGLIVEELNGSGVALRRHAKVELKRPGPYTRLECRLETLPATAQVRFILDTRIHCQYAEGHVTYDDCELRVSD